MKITARLRTMAAMWTVLVTLEGALPRQAMALRGGATGTTPQTTGFIGLGIMGEGMVRRLLHEGAASRLAVWSRDLDKCARLQSEHADGAVVVCDTASDVVQMSEVTYSMLSTPAASEAVFDGPEGAAEAFSEGKVLVDCATFTAERMQDLADRVRAKGAQFLEAPVSGSKKPAADGQLIFLVAGDRSALPLAEPGLDAMGKSTHFLGEEVGLGTRYKLVVNMIMASQLAAVAEGMALCDALELDTATLSTVLGEGVMASPLVAIKAPSIAARSYPPAFPLKHARKDTDYALALAEGCGLELPVAKNADALMLEAMNAGWANEDFAALREAIQ